MRCKTQRVDRRLCSLLAAMALLSRLQGDGRCGPCSTRPSLSDRYVSPTMPLIRSPESGHLRAAGSSSFVLLMSLASSRIHMIWVCAYGVYPPQWFYWLLQPTRRCGEVVDQCRLNYVSSSADRACRGVTMPKTSSNNKNLHQEVSKSVTLTCPGGNLGEISVLLSSPLSPESLSSSPVLSAPPTTQTGNRTRQLGAVDSLAAACHRSGYWR